MFYVLLIAYKEVCNISWYYSFTVKMIRLIYWLKQTECSVTFRRHISFLSKYCLEVSSFFLFVCLFFFETLILDDVVLVNNLWCNRWESSVWRLDRYSQEVINRKSEYNIVYPYNTLCEFGETELIFYLVHISNYSHETYNLHELTTGDIPK